MITIILTIISFVRERNMGTLARLLSSPMTPGEIVAGYALGFGIISSCQSLELLAVGISLFNISIVGSIYLALVLIIALAFGILGLGILLSTLAKNEFQAVQFVPLILIPTILLSGVFWPVEAMPPALRVVPRLIPITYAVNGLRSVMVRGWTLGQILPELAVLIAFAAATLSLSVLVMRRKARRL
jgi:ABC-2 type transport system permease protein